MELLLIPDAFTTPFCITVNCFIGWFNINFSLRAGYVRLPTFATEFAYSVLFTWVIYFILSSLILHFRR
jgi:hypothetical protein